MSDLTLMIIADINNKIGWECHNFPLYDFIVINMFAITLEWVPNPKITIVLWCSIFNTPWSFIISDTSTSLKHLLNGRFSVLLDKKQSTIGEYYPNILVSFHLLKTDTCSHSHAEREHAIYTRFFIVLFFASSIFSSLLFCSFCTERDFSTMHGWIHTQ